MPTKYIGKDLALIETGGAQASFESRIVGIIRFDVSFEYKSKKEFESDKSKHLVESTHPTFGWKTTKRKFGWRVIAVTTLKTPVPPPKPRGIVFASRCRIPKSAM